MQKWIKKAMRARHVQHTCSDGIPGQCLHQQVDPVAKDPQPGACRINLDSEPHLRHKFWSAFCRCCIPVPVTKPLSRKKLVLPVQCSLKAQENLHRNSGQRDQGDPATPPVHQQPNPGSGSLRPEPLRLKLQELLERERVVRSVVRRVSADSKFNNAFISPN